MGRGVGRGALRVWAAILALGLSCAFSTCTSQRSLLEQPGTFAQNGRPLVAAPLDGLATADPSRAAILDDDEAGADSGAPSLAEISMAAPAYDISQKSASLEEEQSKSSVGQRPQWKGTFSQEGVDIVNVSGVLCSAPGRGSPQVVACSDGRVGTFSILPGAHKGRLTLGAEFQAVSLEY